MGFSTKTWINDLQQFDKNVFSAIDADIFKLFLAKNFSELMKYS
jgi:hypothetical protein